MNEVVANSWIVNSFIYYEENFHNEKPEKFSFLNSASITAIRDQFMAFK